MTNTLEQNARRAKMKLYKNVDLRDLPSILDKGILSLSESGNNNWSGRRVKNSCDVVYLFKPLNGGDAFPKYGVALIEVEVEAAKNEMSDHDSNYGKYEEYVAERVPVSCLTNIYVPEILKNRLNDLPESILEKIQFCGIAAQHYTKQGLAEVDEETLEILAATAPLNSTEFNFFRGIRPDRTMVDLYDVKYVF